MVLVISHALRAHEALSGPDALPSLLEVIHRLFEDGVFVGQKRSIRTSASFTPSSPHLQSSPRDARNVYLRLRRGTCLF